MPIYEFQCSRCGKTEERIVLQWDKSIMICPYCGEQMYRIMSITNFSLRGGGWSGDGYSNRTGKSRGRKEI